MTSILRSLLSRWAITFVGTALLALLVWFLGPLLAPLEPWFVRLAIGAILLLLWAGGNFVYDRRKRRRDAALAAGLTGPPAGDPVAEAIEGETAALRDKLSAALKLLRTARGTRGYLYEQPWYVIIGPPGAGKTTALLNAGLRFPLAAEMGQGAVAGVGGTRLCDWWFTESAVLIDTAGRYTTQDSDATVDKAGWGAFLDVLKRTRPRQPLNGVIVAIALNTIAQAPEAERSAHARAVRGRIRDLEAKLGARLPVYVMFTKADLVAGFTEYFDDLDADKREQVWGMTFPLATDEAGPVSRFSAEFALLVGRLNERLIGRLQAERSPDRRALIANFPAQVASFEPALAAFLQEAFVGSKLDPAPSVRGVYLTSGTQSGTPIDRLAGALARTFGLDRQRLPSLRPEHGRSYFLAGLIKRVILGEAMLVAERPGAKRRRRFLRTSGFAAICVAILAFAGLVWQSRAAGESEVERLTQALDRYEQAAHGLKLDPVGDADLPALLPLLDKARALMDDARAPSSMWRLGLSQAGKLEAGAETVYRHALAYALLPRLIWRLEAQIRGNLNQPDFLYEATRVYLMLGGAGPLDRGLVQEWMTLDWRQTFPGPALAPLRESLALHLNAMLAEPLPSVPLDGELVARARAAFSRVSLAQRVYSRVKPSAAAQRVAPWKPSDALGPAGVGVFMRASGRPMTDGIPGFLTVEGFHGVLLPSLGTVAKTVASESWVLGQRMELDPNGPELRALERDVIALYEADYIQAWDAMLADLNVVPLRNLTQAAQDLYILASPQSPMKDLLVSAARQLTLSQPPAPPPGTPAPAAQSAPAPAGGASDRLASLFGGSAQAAQAPALPPGHEIDERYKALRDLVSGGAGAPIDQVLKLLNEMQQRIAKMAAAPIGAAAAAAPSVGVDPTLALRTEAQRQPQPLARWLTTMATGDAALRGGNARQQIIGAYNGAGGPGTLCQAAVTGRYPFVVSAANDVPLDDFARLFAPGGLLDGFFNTQLKPYVNTSGKVWQAQAVDGVQPPVTATDLTQFQRAATIRDLFFANGTAPSVRFDIAPDSLDVATRQAVLDLGGTTIVSAHGPPRFTQITWPGPGGMQNVRLAFDPPPVTGVNALQESGPWAMFRLFGRARMASAGAPDRYNVTFRLADREASFEIRAGSTTNPFAPGLLQDFRCPAVQ